MDDTGARTPDANLCVHSPRALEIAAENALAISCVLKPTTGRYFQIPYRAMLPKGVANLLVTGRSIGGDKISHAAVRNMMCCAVSGQGAGVAAALSVKTGAPFGSLDIGALQAELRRQGVRIH